MIRAARKANRTLLTEVESKLILEEYGIPTVKTVVAKSAEEAVQAAADLGSAGSLEALFRNSHSQDGRRRRKAESPK